MKEKQETKGISKVTIARMPLYLHFLQEENSKGAKYISSSVVGTRPQRSRARFFATGQAEDGVCRGATYCGY